MTGVLDPERLRRWVRAFIGPQAELLGVERMPGHSGITVGVDVQPDPSAGGPERLVLRVPPAGVKQAGITDVLRQVPLLQAMHEAGVPVPAVRFWGDDPSWFGVPFLVVERVPGVTPGDLWDRAWHMPAELAGEGRSLTSPAIEALAAIHSVDWETALGDWDRPRSAGTEIERCSRLLERSAPMPWNADARRLGERLLADPPADPEPGVVHSDFYSNNWIFHDGDLAAVIDWEGSFIGPRPLDVGWLCMMYDPAGWHPRHHARIAWAPPPEQLAQEYGALTGYDMSTLPWYRALAGYRLACLTTYYLGLHRRGRRPDEVWEHLGESAEAMVARGHELLASAG